MPEVTSKRNLRHLNRERLYEGPKHLGDIGFSIEDETWHASSQDSVRSFSSREEALNWLVKLTAERECVQNKS